MADIWLANERKIELLVNRSIWPWKHLDHLRLLISIEKKTLGHGSWSFNVEHRWLFNIGFLVMDAYRQIWRTTFLWSLKTGAFLRDVVVCTVLLDMSFIRFRVKLTDEWYVSHKCTICLQEIQLKYKVNRTFTIYSLTWFIQGKRMGKSYIFHRSYNVWIRCRVCSL